MKQKERANAQIAHLVFTATQASTEKPKELFFQLTLDKELITCKS